MMDGRAGGRAGENAHVSKQWTQTYSWLGFSCSRRSFFKAGPSGHSFVRSGTGTMMPAQSSA